jgi:hypothetical protein
MIDSDMIDLYEEMLYERAAKGIRPVLYVSSPRDFECSAIMLLHRPAEGLAPRRLGPSELIHYCIKKK